MNVYEIQWKLCLLKDVVAEEVPAEIAKLIDSTLATNDLLDFHESNKYKNYCFDSLYPVPADKIYRNETICSVRIRTISNELAQFFSNKLNHQYNYSLQGLSSSIKIIPRKQINKVFSLTPMILKFEGGYWKNVISFEEFEERFKVNLIKKYNLIMNTKIEEDFPLYTSLKLLNNKPVSMKYKDVSLLGDKIEMVIASNETAQELMYMALGTGLGEMNSRGAGFINFRWV